MQRCNIINYGKEFYNLDNVQIFTNSLIDYGVLAGENGLINHPFTYINNDCNTINDINKLKTILYNEQKNIDDLYNDIHNYDSYYKCLNTLLSE